MAAEDAPIGVQLVDDDDLDLLEELEPLGVMGEDRRVEHVRVGDDHLAGRPDGRPDGRRRVAVVRGCRDVQRARHARAPANSATWSWPRALVGKRKRARADGSWARAWRTGRV